MSENSRLIIRVINSELVQPMCPRYSNVTDGQTDRQTDGWTTYDSNTALALRGSRGENVQLICIPLQIVDPIPWRHLASEGGKIIGLFRHC